jgi:hypothetical protein
MNNNESPLMTTNDYKCPQMMLNDKNLLLSVVIILMLIFVYEINY